LPVTSSIRVTETAAANASVVEGLRFNPGSEVLRELRRIGVSTPKFDGREDKAIIRAADQLFAGRYILREPAITVTLPFDGSEEVFGIAGWDLKLCSFIVPALLARAFDITKDTQYLDAAVDYIVAWAAFESSLLIPRGYIFNDHATATRAIIVTDVWRLYRGSPSYDDTVANELLRYVQRLRQLLSKPEFFEFRTNHGFMQSLSLLHLSIAFPALEGTNNYTSLAVNRLVAQLPYHVNSEGIILEHSAGYHHNGLHRLTAAWRYLGILNIPVPEELALRYEKSLDVNVQLLRPDRTLPLFGDTRTREYGLYPVAKFEEDSRIVNRTVTVDPAEAKPEPSMIAPAAGLAVFWSGLDAWPTAERLSQTVVHWGNFVTQSHKHADEMSISLWAVGQQWVRGIGTWPYGKSRRRAIGWRSSNAPHWLDEPGLVERDAVLESRSTGDEVEFLELVRRNIDGSEIRRQLVLVGGKHWIALDSYHTDTPREAEVLWRFSPDLSVERARGNGVFRAESADGSSLEVQLLGNEDWAIESDLNGEAQWNTGVVFDRELISSPAIRGTSSGTDLAIATAFSIGASEAQSGSSLQWQSNEEWSLSLGRGPGKALRVERQANNLAVKRSDQMTQNLRILSVDDEATVLAQEEKAFLQMQAKYGQPIQFRIEQRVKVSIAVMLATLLQWLAFFLVRTWLSRMWVATLTLSIACWIGVCLFLNLQFLA
jgi:hypothetical protein